MGSEAKDIQLEQMQEAVKNLTINEKNSLLTRLKGDIPKRLLMLLMGASVMAGSVGIAEASDEDKFEAIRKKSKTAFEELDRVTEDMGEFSSSHTFDLSDKPSEDHRFDGVKQRSDEAFQELDDMKIEHSGSTAQGGSASASESQVDSNETQGSNKKAPEITITESRTTIKGGDVVTEAEGEGTDGSKVHILEADIGPETAQEASRLSSFGIIKEIKDGSLSFDQFVSKIEEARGGKALTAEETSSLKGGYNFAKNGRNLSLARDVLQNRVLTVLAGR